MDLAELFEPYRFTESQAVSLGQQFTRVLEKTPLKGCERIRPALEAYRGMPGLYFWTLCHRGVEHRIYLGRTRDLAKRVGDYLAKFQAHSPNDFKLQIFAEYVAAVLPEASLNYYVAPARGTDAELKTSETAAVREFRPLLNHLKRSSEEARAALADAFRVYYRSCFERTLLGGKA